MLQPANKRGCGMHQGSKNWEKMGVRLGHQIKGQKKKYRIHKQNEEEILFHFNFLVWKNAWNKPSEEGAGKTVRGESGKSGKGCFHNFVVTGPSEGDQVDRSKTKNLLLG